MRQEERFAASLHADGALDAELESGPTRESPSIEDVIKAGILPEAQKKQAKELAKKVPGLANALMKLRVLPAQSVSNPDYDLADPKQFLEKPTPESEDEDEDVFYDAEEYQTTTKEDEVWFDAEEYTPDDDDEDVFHDAQDNQDWVKRVPPVQDVIEELNVGSLLQDYNQTEALWEEHLGSSALQINLDEEDEREAAGCKMVGRRQGAQVVMNLGKMAASGIMTGTEFADEVGDGKITTCKQDEVFHMKTLSEFVAQEEACPEDHDVEECLNKEEDTQKALLSRASTDFMNFEGLEDVEPRQCTCASGSPIMQQKHLSDIINKTKIKKSPFMNFEAAKIYCRALGAHVGTSLRPSFNKACAPENFGYCCSRSEQAESANRHREQRMMKAATDLAALVENVIADTAKLFEQVKDVQEASGVEKEHKVMMYKLYIIHFHHTQVFIKRHQYCVQNPEDVKNCEDIMVFYHTMKGVAKKLRRTRENMLTLVSCMQYGVRRLSDELATSGTVVQKSWGLFTNVVYRSIRYVTTGQLTRRVTRLAVSFGKLVWRYRFELTMAGFIVVGIQPLMTAITATGVTTVAASSWSLVFEQLIRNVIIHIGCPILKSTLLMSMVMRWTIAKIILSDFFIDNCIGPLWTIIKSFTPLGMLSNIASFSVGAVKKLLKTIGNLLRPANATRTIHQKETWLTAARKLHMSPVADVLYGFLSVWVAGIWRTIAGLVCAALKVGNTVVSAAETVVDVGLNQATGWWSKATAAASSGLKYFMGDDTWDVAVSMAEADEVAASLSSGLAPKALQTAHMALSKVDWATSMVAHGSLDTAMWALETVGSSAMVVWCLSGILGFFFKDYYKPQGGDVSGMSLEDTLTSIGHSSRSNFNEQACLGKKIFEPCIYLNHAGLDTEEVIDGQCCYARCQPKDAQCEVLTDAEVRQQSEFNPTAVSTTSLSRQSRYLSGFVDMARKGYGAWCEREEEE